MPNKFISSTQRKKNKSIFRKTTKDDALHYTKTKKSLKFYTFRIYCHIRISGTIITYYSYYYYLRSSYSHHVGITDGTKLCSEMEINVVPHSKLPAQKSSTVHFNSYCPIVSHGATQPPIKWRPGALSLAAKWLGCEAGQSPPLYVGGSECIQLCLQLQGK
jgi:hypothetical protein